MNYYYSVEGDFRNNLGDVLQGMVAKAFLPSNALAVNREALDDMDKKDQGLLIANGWYMHNLSKFPPPPNISPVYISVHIANSALLSSPQVREHFRKNSPIGCRDKKTLNLFLGWGIPAYYSGCLTVTTQKETTASLAENGEAILVDNVDHPVPENVQLKLEELLGARLIRVSHNPPCVSGDFEGYVQRSELHMAELLERYSKAKIVVTTKIHCALPCLGMGARVVLIHPNPRDPRLNAVKEFMRIISYEELLKTKSLDIPQINGKRLNNRKKLLRRIVQTSVDLGTSSLLRPEDKMLKNLVAQSKMRARFYRWAVLLMYRLGIKRTRLKRVYGLDL